MTDTVIEYSLCLAVLTVILVGVLLPSGKKDKKAVRFMVLVIAIMAYISISMLSDVLEGEAGNTLLIYFSNLLTYLNIDFVIISFARYYKSMLGQITHKNSLPFYISMLMCCARTVLILVMFFCGSLFYVKDGYYHDYPTTIIPYIAVVAIMAVLLVGIIINRRNYTPKQFTVAIVYLLLPVPAVIVELLTDIYTLTGVALTICVLIIYALIQDIEIYRGKMRETMLEEISATDLLTGLNNRRTYYNVLGSLSSEQDVGVLFCDINGLKYTNDHYGHAAGDELIKRFADMLIDSFRSGEVFRISGDERFGSRLSPSPSVPIFRLFRRKSDRICAAFGKIDRKVIDARDGASLLYCELSDVYSIPLYPFFSAFPSKYRNANAGIRRRFFPPGVL